MPRTIPQQERFDGGLVTARPPALLQPGELAVAEECYYKPNSLAVYPIPDRATANSNTVPATVRGIRYVERDSPNDNLVWIHTTAVNRYYYANADGSLSFLAISLSGVSPSAGTHLEVAQHGQETVLMNGTDVPLLTTGDPSTAANNAPSGYAMNTVAPTGSASGVGSGWNSDQGAGDYWYWITEYNSALDIESGFSGTPLAVTVVETNDQVDLTLPGAVSINPTATHFRIYRSIKANGTDSYDNPFPSGFLIATVTAATASYVDDGTPDESTPYPTVVVSSNITTASDQNGTPPSAWSGDIFENSLVVIDADDRSRLRYSYPDNIRSWPDAYYLNFETKTRDTAEYIRTVDNKLIVGMQEQLWRINSLPRATDAEFDRGRVAQLISLNHGIVGPNAADVFTNHQGITRLAFVDRDGLFQTDGFRIDPLEADLDWPALVEQVDSTLRDAVLRNDARRQLLVLYYPPSGETSNLKILFLHYAAQHLKPNPGGGAPRLKVTGPHTLTGIDAMYQHASGFTPSLHTLQSDGTVLREGFSSSTTDLHIRTRQLFGGDPDDTIQHRRGYIYHDANAGGTVSIKLLDQRVGGAATELTPAVTLTPTNQGFSHAYATRTTAGYQLDVTSDTPVHVWLPEIDQPEGFV